MSSVETEISRFVDLGFFGRERGKSGFCTESQLSELLRVENPCLVIIKPHAVAKEGIEPFLEMVVSKLGLSVAIKKRVELTENNVFGLYGDLLDVMKQGDEGVNFVKGLVSSFVGSGESLVYVVTGHDSYQKMKAAKRFLRCIGAEDRFRNVMHSSDDLNEAIRGVNVLLTK